MKVIPAIRRLLGLTAVILALAFVAAACSDGDGDAVEEVEAPSSAGGAEDEVADEEVADEEAASDFPVEIDSSSGAVTIEAKPERVVSLSPTATEMLFAIGAGEQVVAVDQYSNFPAEAPEPSLDGFTPDLEAILANNPDLVVASGLPEDIAAALTAGGVPVLFLPAASSFDDTYDQIAQLGVATGQIDGAAETNADIRDGISEVIAELPETDSPIRVFHEIDDSFYTASSGSFIGQVYSSMGFENIADPLDDGSGFPQVDGESIIAADPSLIVFTTLAGYSADDIAARPGWDTTSAVANGNIVQVDADISSRWGPRIVEFMQAIVEVLSVDA